MATIISTHFQELYSRSLYVALSWFLCIIVSYSYKEHVLLWITHEVFSREIEIIYLNLPEALWNLLLISMWLGFLVVIPWAILNYYAYFRSGLYQYEAMYWDQLIKFIVIGWIPYNITQITMVWPKIVNWFLSYGENYSHLTYLPTMNEFFTFLLNWSIMTTVILGFTIGLLSRVLTKRESTMKGYIEHREKILLVTLIIGGIITPPDIISQIIVGVLIMGTLELMVMIESIKLSLDHPWRAFVA